MSEVIKNKKIRKFRNLTRVNTPVLFTTVQGPQLFKMHTVRKLRQMQILSSQKCSLFITEP